MTSAAMPTARDDNLNEREATRRLGISRISLFRLRRAGLIGYYCIGGRVLYSPEHIRAYLATVERRPNGRREGRQRS
jgi:predicted site-specific integrase-resolvase